MAQTKKYRVVYHLGSGVEAAIVVEAGSPKEAASGLDSDSMLEFTGENNTFFQFRMSEVKMVSATEM